MSTAIDRWVRVELAEADGCHLSAERLGLEVHASSVRHAEEVDSRARLMTATLAAAGVEGDVSLTVRSDVPPESGLGVSSSTIVAILAAADLYRREPRPVQELAEAAYTVERQHLNAPVGRQDHMAAAFGGTRIYEFGEGYAKSRARLPTSPASSKLLRQTQVYLTNTAGSSTLALAAQVRGLGASARVQSRMRTLVSLVQPTQRALRSGDPVMLGQLLHRSWSIKRELAEEVTTASLDSWYEKAMSSGAIGGKVTGAGGRGSLLLVVPTEHQKRVRCALGGLTYLGHVDACRAGAHAREVCGG